MTENREAFVRRIDFLPPSDRALVKLAYVLSKAGHRGQTRKERCPNTGEPLRYFEHTRRAFLILFDELEITDPETLASALMHDLPEDSDLFSEYELETYFGRGIVARLLLLRKDDRHPKEMYMYRLHRYAGPETLLVKFADRLDNQRSLICEGVDISFIERQVKETREKYIPLGDILMDRARDTKFESASIKVIHLLREQLAANEARLAMMKTSDSGPPDPGVVS